MYSISSIKYSLIFILPFAVCVIIYVIVSSNKNYHRDVNLQVYGIVKNIKVDSSQRLTAYFLVNDNWETFGNYNREMLISVNVGDSIAKKKGIENLLIYRQKPDKFFLFKKMKL